MCLSTSEESQMDVQGSQNISDKELALLEEAATQFSNWGKLSSENLERVKAIQKILQYEEGKETSLDETLTYVLRVYRGFVPYC